MNTLRFEIFAPKKRKDSESCLTQREKKQFKIVSLFEVSSGVKLFQCGCSRVARKIQALLARVA
jgi:hypothetical protein